MQSGQLSSFQVSNSRGSPSSIATRKPNAHYRHPTQPVEDQLTDDQVDQKHEFQTRPTDQNAKDVPGAPSTLNDVAVSGSQDAKPKRQSACTPNHNASTCRRTSLATTPRTACLYRTYAYQEHQTCTLPSQPASRPFTVPTPPAEDQSDSYFAQGRELCTV